MCNFTAYHAECVKRKALMSEKSSVKSSVESKTRKRLTSVEPFQTTIGFKARKAAHFVAYVLLLGEKTDDKRKIMQLLYLLDRDTLERWRVFSIYDEHYLFPDGPRGLSCFLGLKGLIDEDIWSKYFTSDTKHSLTLRSDISLGDLDELSQSDISIAKSFNEKFGQKNWMQLRSWIKKNCIEYLSIENGKLPISPKQMAIALNLPNPIDFEEYVSHYRSSILLVGM
jgi:hypothetical protein